MTEAAIPSTLSELLTPLGMEILRAGAPISYASLVPDAGANVSDATRALDRILTPGQVLALPVRNLSDAECVLAGLWLWHDQLDRSHTISQSISSESGSFWHAIMHRREGDFSNAKYWNARCRHHPVRVDLPILIESKLAGDPSYRIAERLMRNGWDADGFVDLVEEVYRKPDDPRHAIAVRLQQLEWTALAEHCARAAVSRV